MENHKSILDQINHRSGLISCAYLSRDHQSKYRFGIEAARNESEDLSSFTAVPLGALLQLWQAGDMIMHETPFQEPLHIVRAVGHRALNRVWIEGILRKSRKWVQCAVLDNDRTVPWDKITACADQFVHNKTDLLWHSYRRYVAYQSTLERLQSASDRDLTDAAWLHKLQLPGWVELWGSSSFSSLRSSCESMVKVLTDICSKPLTDPVWEKGATDFDWIPTRNSARWSLWQKGFSSGVNDHRARRYCEDTFTKTLSKCIDQEIEVSVLPKIIAQIKGSRDESLDEFGATRF